MTMRTLTQRLAGGGGPKRQIAAAAGAIIVVAIVIGIIVSAGAPASSKGQSSGSTASGATTVQRRDLVETDTESGTLGYANAQTVFNRLSGTVTYLPNVGQVVKTGGSLYQVDGYPVILFNGSYPAYRDLTSGDTNGPDIEELNADLKAMGFDPDNAITVDQTWQDATTAAVESFQGSIGQTETGTITLGQIVFLPGPQLVNAVDTTLGSTGGAAASGSAATGSGSSGSSGAADSSDPTSTATPADYRITGQPQAEFVDLTTSSAPTGNSTPAATPAATTTPACPSDPTTTTTTTPTTGCPTVTTPTTTTPAPTPTTTPTTTTPGTTPPMSGTPSSSALEAIVKLLQSQNRLLQAELKSAKTSGATGTGKGSSSSGGSSGGGGGGGGGGGSVSASATSSGSGSSTSGTGSASSGGSSAEAILSTTSTSLIVTVDLDATKQSEAKLHEPVTVELPDGSTVNGKITGVSPVATASTSGSSSSSPSASAPSATIPVTVSLQKQTDTRGLDQAAVSVNFEEQVANNVLSVPVTALLATQGGGYAVQEAAAPHKLIAVTPGLFAAGYVQISGPDVQDGMQVTDSQG
jgi:hypothetical protein